jgi:cytosine/adenosine deaminase-related metal-dependent hydrolase
MVACNTRRADTLVDVTADRVGLSALEILAELGDARKTEIELRVGAYTPLGFRDCQPERWEIYVEGARRADFLAALPEADDVDDYPEHIGFEESCQRVLALASELGKPLHVHTDQRVEPSERGTERLLDVMRAHGGPAAVDGEPSVWVVHMVSPTTYDQERFEALVAGLVEQGVGVIVCPSAALGMRQLRSVSTPRDNSIPRVLELLDGGVHVRLASDNVADICSPSTTADLVDEVFALSAAIRYYDVDLLARLAAGERPSAEELRAVRDHLKKNEAEIAKALDATLAQA